MGGLLHAIHGALKPSPRVQGVLEARQRALAAAMGGSLPSDRGTALPQYLQYLAVHFLDDSAWESYCEDRVDEDYEEPRVSRLAWAALLLLSVGMGPVLDEHTVFGGQCQAGERGCTWPTNC